MTTYRDNGAALWKRSPKAIRTMKPASPEQSADHERDYRKHETPRTLIYILSVEHKYGTDHSAHSTYSKAMDALASYVAQWWNQETAMRDDERPADTDQLINSYFEAIDYRESYEITESILD